MISKGEMGTILRRRRKFLGIRSNFGPPQIQLSPSPENKGGTAGRGGTAEVISPDTSLIQNFGSPPATSSNHYLFLKVSF